MAPAALLDGGLSNGMVIKSGRIDGNHGILPQGIDGDLGKGICGRVRSEEYLQVRDDPFRMVVVMEDVETLDGILQSN